MESHARLTVSFLFYRSVAAIGFPTELDKMHKNWTAKCKLTCKLITALHCKSHNTALGAKKYFPCMKIRQKTYKATATGFQCPYIPLSPLLKQKKESGPNTDDNEPRFTQLFTSVQISVHKTLWRHQMEPKCKPQMSSWKARKLFGPANQNVSTNREV